MDGEHEMKEYLRGKAPSGVKVVFEEAVEFDCAVTCTAPNVVNERSVKRTLKRCAKEDFIVTLARSEY